MAAERRPKDPWRSPEERALLMRFALAATDALRGPIAAFGLDPPVFRGLLRARVLLGLRPAASSSGGWNVAGPALAILMSWFAGLGTGITALVADDARVWVVVSLSALMFLLAMLLFQVLAGILVDPTDIGVVAAHPIRDRTLFAVRLAELSLYVLVFVASFTAGNVMVAVFGKAPLAVLLVYPLLALLAGATAMGLVALLFALCLRVVGPRHFQRVTLWAQIVGGAALFAAFQVPRLVHREQWGLWAEELRAMRLAWPPFLYAEAFELACGRAGNVLAAGAGLLLPAAALAATFALASRYFVAGLSGTLSAPKPRAGWPDGLVARAGRRLARGFERCGFDFAAALSRREPAFLRGVLPQLVMFQMMSLGMGFGVRGQASMFFPLSAGMLYLSLPNALTLSQGTPVPDARGVFDSAPLADHGPLLRGGVKALVVQWFGVPALLLGCVHLLVGGLGALPRSLLALELTAVVVLLSVRRFDLHVPFTRQIRFGEMGSRNLGIVLVSGLVMAVIVAAHYGLSRHPLSLAGGILACSALLVPLWRGLGGMRPIAARRERE